MLINKLINKMQEYFTFRAGSSKTRSETKFWRLEKLGERHDGMKAC